LFFLSRCFLHSLLSQLILLCTYLCVFHIQICSYLFLSLFFFSLQPASSFFQHLIVYISTGGSFFLLSC
jgi:hypothetical protein